MKRIYSLGLSALCLLLIAAKPAKAPSLPSGDIFFTVKGQPYALEKTFPGIVAAFMFTEDQKIALNEEYQETVADPQLREKGASLKNNPAVTDAERDEMRKQMAEARAELQKQVETILTPEQKALIPRIQAAAEQALKGAREAFPADPGAAKGEKTRSKELDEKIRVEAEDLFVQQLEKFLKPEQMEAVRLAAIAQREGEERARKNKLGK
jgi:hypothetical protein